MVVHWDDVAQAERDFGHIHATRQLLGRAAGAQATGLSRWRIDAGCVCAPAHVHADEEEIFHVLEGSGFALLSRRAFPISAGDTLVFPAGGRPHTVFGGPIDVLAFGEGSAGGLTWLPRSNTMWAGPRWLPLDASHPFEAEAALGPLELPEPAEPAAERPPWIVAPTDVEAVVTRRGATDVARRPLGRAAGTRRSGLKHVVIAPGAESHPPHCHSSEEELFVVLDGSGSLLLGEETFPVRRGSVIARPAATGVAHSFSAGADGLTLLAYGQRRNEDQIYYPRSQKVSLRGLGVMLRVEPLDYWDGEE